VSLQTVILLGLPNYWHQFYPRSKQGFITNCYSRGGANQRWILHKKRRLKMCFSRYNQCPSPHATLKHLISLPSTQLFVVLGEYTFLNRKSSFLWVPTVSLFSSTSTCIRMRQNSYRGFSRSTKRSSSDPFISLSAIQVMSFHYISLVILLIASIPLTLI
jgi:hypothetical protein